MQRYNTGTQSLQGTIRANCILYLVVFSLIGRVVIRRFTQYESPAMSMFTAPATISNYFNMIQVDETNLK